MSEENIPFTQMTIRDVLAASAMQGMLVNTEIVADDAPETLSMLATDAYAMADAMLAARKAVK